MQHSSTYQCRVYHADTDLYGVVWHGTYLDYFSRARTEFLREKGICLTNLSRESGVIFPVAQVTLSYYKPAVLDDLLLIHTVLVRVKAASLFFKQELSCETEPERLLCRGEIKVACTSHTLAPCPLPPSLKEQLCDR